MRNDILEMLIRRSRGQEPPAPAGATAFAPYGINCNGGGTARYYHFLENGALWHASSDTAGSATRLGDKADFVSITHSASGTGVTASGCYALDAAGACWLVSGTSAPVEAISSGVTAVAGCRCVLTNASSVTLTTAAIAICSDGLYRLSGTTATQISDRTDFVAVSGQLHQYNAANRDEALALDSSGVVWRVPWSGTPTRAYAEETGLLFSGISGLWRANSSASLVGELYALVPSGSSGWSAPVGHHASSGGRGLAISASGELMATTGTHTWEAIDANGTWTCIWGCLTGSGTGAWGVRDGVLCSISGTSSPTVTATAQTGVSSCGWNGRHVNAAGYVCNAAGERLTNAS